MLYYYYLGIYLNAIYCKVIFYICGKQYIKVTIELLDDPTMDAKIMLKYSCYIFSQFYVVGYYL